MYTATIEDTVIFRSLWKSRNQQLQSLNQAVEEACTGLYVSFSIYHSSIEQNKCYGPSDPWYFMTHAL